MSVATRASRRAWHVTAATLAAPAVLLAVDLRGPGWVTDRDASWSSSIIEHRSSLVGIVEVVTRFGSFGVLVLLAVVATVGLGLVGHHRRVTLAPLVSLLVTGIGVYSTKRLFDRDRPDIALHLDSVRDASFPSGHAADGMAFFLALGIVIAIGSERPLHRRLAIGLGALAGILVGLTRPVLGVHWLTDVVAGWSLGAAVSVLVVGWLARSGEVSPRPSARRPGQPP